MDQAFGLRTGVQKGFPMVMQAQIQMCNFRLLTSTYTLPNTAVAEIEFQLTTVLFPLDRTKAFLLSQPQIFPGVYKNAKQRGRLSEPSVKPPLPGRTCLIHFSMKGEACSQKMGMFVLDDIFGIQIRDRVVQWQ